LGQVRNSQEDIGNGSSRLSILINKLQITIRSHIAEVTSSSLVSPTTFHKEIKKTRDSQAAAGFDLLTIRIVWHIASDKPPEAYRADTEHQQGQHHQAVLIQRWDTFKEHGVSECAVIAATCRNITPVAIVN